MFKVPQIPRVGQPRYKKLKQEDGLDFSSDEEVLYDQQPQLKDMGSNREADLDFMFSSYDVNEDLKLPKESSFVSRPKLSCSRRKCLISIVIATVCAAILAFVILFFYLKAANAATTIDTMPVAPSTPTTTTPIHTKPTPKPPPIAYTPVNYTLEYSGVLSEVTPMFYDLNGDDTLDVVFGIGRQEGSAMVYWQCHNVEVAKKACMRDFGFYPCGSTQIAVNGKTGETLWIYPIAQEVFAFTCNEDLNRDGINDCMMCGRGGMWHAVDGKTGEKLWDVDRTIVIIFHNFYFPLAVGDLDKDGTVDFVNVHGGDPRYKADNHDRPPARFVAVSGKTGQKLLDPLLVPDMKESYMNPIRYRTEDEDFILFGSGGETIEGGLWAVTIKSLRDKIELYIGDHREEYQNYDNNHVTNPNCEEHPLKTALEIMPKVDTTQYTISDVLDQSALDEYHKACPKTIFHPIPNVHNLCIYGVVFSPEKGVILPPVIIDMNNDGVEDLVISLYSGHTTVMNGQSGEVIWDRYVPGTESYSIPAPLYFNEDQIPDLLIRVNKGEWDTHYNYSYVGIVDGVNGELLWALNSSEVGFMSGTTLRAEGYGKDALLFLTVGMLPTEPLDKVKSKELVTFGNMTPHHYRSKRAVTPKDRKSFSPTEELDKLLGHRIERDVIKELADVMNANDSREDTSNANFSAGSASQTMTSSFDPQSLATTVVSSTSTSVVTVTSSSTPPSISNANNTSENIQGTVVWNPSVAVSPSEEEGLSMSTLALPLKGVSKVEEVSTVPTSESIVTGATSSVQAPVLPDKSGNPSLVVDSSAAPSIGSGGFSSSDVPKPHSTTKAPISSPSRGINSGSSSTSTGIIVDKLSATTQSSSSLSSSSPSSIPTSSSILLVGKSSSSATVQQSTTSLKASVQSSQPSAPSPSSVSTTSHSSVPISSLGLSSSEISGTSVPLSTTTSPPASPSYLSDKILEGIDKGRRYFEQLRNNNLLKFWENWHEIYHHDPKNETKEFMKEDCHSYKKSDYIYFLTADMIRNNSIHPIFTEEPRLTFPDVNKLNAFFQTDPRRRRRHGNNDEDSDDHKSLSLEEIRAQWGCHHVIHPSMVVSTPSFVDVNGDGHLEVVYLEYMSGTSTPAFGTVPNKLSTAKVYLKVVTLKKAFNQKLGDKAAVNFNAFLPFDKQPWTKYMGSNGDNVYRENV